MKIKDSGVVYPPNGIVTDAILRRLKDMLQLSGSTKRAANERATSSWSKNQKRRQRRPSNRAKSDRFSAELARVVYRSPLDAQLKEPLGLFESRQTFVPRKRVVKKSLIIMRVAGTDQYVVIKDKNRQFPGFVTGRIDPENSELLTAQNEAFEEAGIQAEEERFIKIGTVPLGAEAQSLMSVFLLELSLEEAELIRPGNDQEWVRLASKDRIVHVIEEGRFDHIQKSAFDLCQEGEL